MQTLAHFFRRDSAYWGDRHDWLVAATQHRDSDALGRSNWRCAKALLKAAIPTDYGVQNAPELFQPVAIERASHWAVGWIDYLLVDPQCGPVRQAAEQIEKRLADYPILDEFDFSQEETDEDNEVWRSCFHPSERIAWIRRNGSCEFHDWRDMLACVRGQYAPSPNNGERVSQ